MKNRLVYILILFVVAASGCNRQNDDTIAETEEIVPVLSVPGVIQLPTSDGFVELEESSCSSVMLYCWLPLGEYPESETDLALLATLEERGITPVPVQFIPEVRNASQTQLNSLGISLGVALGDKDLQNFLVVDNLPAAALIRADGSVVRASGFGCVERTLRGEQ